MKYRLLSKFIFTISFILVGFVVISLTSNSIYAATFTVDSTGDEADSVGGDGLCLTALGTCTLRAAITAASNIAGADNIHFNIPTSDPGYRDYDTPDTPSSGDSLGGDDYWTIRPVTLLGYIFGTFDGATQETNSGFDRNTYGPDIEVDASGIPNPGPQDQAIIGLIGTNGVINNLVLNSYGYGAGIFSNANGITITNNYIGTDVKGLVRKPSVSGIGLNQANNVVIGNDQSDGNVITATTYGIINNCTNPNTHKISGNKIGLGADGVTAMPMVTGIFMHTNCNSIIGGDTVAERNYIASTTAYAIRFEGNLNATTAVHEVYNNYFGTDVSGNILQSLEIKDAAIMDVYGGDLVGYKTITIGAAGKGNLIANSRYGIRLNVPKSIVTISSNTIVKTIWGVIGYKYSNPDPDADTNWYKDITITNNYIGDYANPDPYFGLTFVAGDWTCTDCYDQKYINRTGISLGGFNGIIKGNKIIGNLYNGIITDNYSSLSIDSVIGGQNALTGSLCFGLEKNCVQDNGTHPLDNSFGGGISLTMSQPTNFSSIFADNYFGSGNGVNLDENVTLYTTGEFELLSGTVRRTDLANFDLTIPSPSGIELYDGWGGVYNDGHPGPTLEYTNYNVYCYDPLTCPESGTSSGTDEMTATLISKAGYQDYEPGWFQYYITDAYSYVPLVKIGNDGIRIENTLIKFEQNHFASKLFSFDADSTTHPQDYPGLGEPWTDDITATQATSLNKHYYSTESGIKQVMEVQYVDSNPIRQNDGSYIITVDSSSDEDNVSTCGYDDGYGAYSGGGCGGVDGLPNGLTSLAEAIFTKDELIAQGKSVSIAFADSVPPSVSEGFFDIELVYPTNNAVISDATPLLDWNASLDPYITKFEVYLDGAKIGETSPTASQFQLTGNLIGTHNWNIIGKRSDNTLSGDSATYNFSVDLNVQSLTLNYPASNTVIDSLSPIFQWSDSANSQANWYEIYLDNVFYTSLSRISGVNQEYQVEIPLSEKTYTWQVVGFIRAANSSGDLVNTEVGRSITGYFEILLPVGSIISDPVSFPTSYTQEDPDSNSSVPDPLNKPTESSSNQILDFLRNLLNPQNTLTGVILPSIPLIGGVILFAKIIPAISILQLGALIGIYIHKRKRYFGLVYDFESKEIIPLVVIELLSLDGRLLDKSISDFKGRYSLAIDNKKEYLLRTKVQGYQNKEITFKGMYGNSLITFDIDLKRDPTSKTISYSSFNGDATTPNFIFRTLKVLMVIGFVYSLLVFLVSPSVINLVILIIYLIILGFNIFIYIQNKREKGVVIANQSGLPLKGIIFKILNNKGIIIDTGITKEDGVMKIRLDEGLYTLSTNFNGSVQNQEIKVNKRGFVEGDIIISQQNPSNSSPQEFNPFS